MNHYNTSIKALMQAQASYINLHKEPPIFLSDWDVDFKNTAIPSLNSSFNKERANKYYFWTDEHEYKKCFSNYYSNVFQNNIEDSNFILTNNGTSSISISLMALKELQICRALLFTPIYFATLNVLEEFNFNTTCFDLSFKEDLIIDYEKLEQTIIDNNIQLLIITNPIFGAGIEFPQQILHKLVSICNKYDIWLLMDYIYGGMKWNEENDINYIFNNTTYEIINKSNKYIFIESISKRVFLNGVKNAFIFSSSNIQRRLLRLSIFMIGSMCFTQLDMFKQLYNIKNSKYICSYIKRNIANARNQYYLIQTILNNSGVILHNCNSGYFCLICIPKKDNIDDIEFSIKMLNQIGVLTTPHSRYLFNYPGYYCFRVNLLLDNTQVLEGISKIKNLI